MSERIIPTPLELMPERKPFKPQPISYAIPTEFILDPPASAEVLEAMAERGREFKRWADGQVADAIMNGRLRFPDVDP